MEAIRVSKADFIAAVTKNRDNHRAIFERAVEAYRVKAVELLEKNIARIKAGSMERVVVTLPLPTDHTDDYNRVLGMMEMELNDEILLSEREFAQYVLDEWGWQAEFTATNATYGVTQTI